MWIGVKSECSGHTGSIELHVETFRQTRSRVRYQAPDGAALIQNLQRRKTAVFVCKNRQVPQDFVEHGWNFGGQADAAVKSKEEGAATA